MIIDTSKEDVWFTSDTHFGHKNIIKYCNRPYESIDQMNDDMVVRWNKRVKPDDWVFHIGDVHFLGDENKERKFLQRLNGKIVLITGNHDRNPSEHNYFKIYRGLYETKFIIEGEEKLFVLCHYAMRIWNKSHRGSIHLYGHSHGSLPDDKNALSMDVGCDCHDYAPIHITEVMKKMAAKDWKPIDHHE